MCARKFNITDKSTLGIMVDKSKSKYLEDTSNESNVVDDILYLFFG